MSHWYDKHGNPCHTMKTQPGAKKPERPTNLRDARKLNLFPSVTTILGVLSKGHLEEWKYKQITAACYKERMTFKYSGLSVTDSPEIYHRKMVEQSKQITKTASDTGNKIHDALDRWQKGKDYDSEYDLYIAAVAEVFKKHEIVPAHSERRFVSQVGGYAGTVDIIALKGGHPYVVDFKTCQNLPDKPRQGHPEQIAAYHKGMWFKATMGGMNLYLSTKVPGTYHVHEYSHDDLMKAWKTFEASAIVWRNHNNYDPRDKEAVA